MVRPIQKKYKDGTPYVRRPAVEAEIAALESLELSELEERSRISSKQCAGYISIEALLYFVRNTHSDRFNSVLLTELLRRFQRLLPRAALSRSDTTSLTSTFIREATNDVFTGLLLSDQQVYNEKLDYYEINFNHAVVCDRRDAEEKYWASENRQKPIENDLDVEVLESSDHSSVYEPLSPEEFDKIIYRQNLEEAIKELPAIQQRVIELWLNDVPATSNDDSAITMSKVLKVNEKTARTHLKIAFESLRKKLEFPRKKK